MRKDIDLMIENASKAEVMLKLLANKNRLMILCYLIKGEKSVGQLSELVGLSSSALSQHLAKMKRQNMVSDDKRGQTVYYKICNMEVQSILSTLYLIYCQS